VKAKNGVYLLHMQTGGAQVPMQLEHPSHISEKPYGTMRKVRFLPPQPSRVQHELHYLSIGTRALMSHLSHGTRALDCRPIPRQAANIGMDRKNDTITKRPIYLIISIIKI
jgi:hypothetical protein